MKTYIELKAVCDNGQFSGITIAGGMPKLNTKPETFALSSEDEGGIIYMLINNTLAAYCRATFKDEKEMSDKLASYAKKIRENFYTNE